MIRRVYVESALADHPRVEKILGKFFQAEVVSIERYGEVFHPKAQNFRLQKRRPSLILADKYAGHVLPTPPGYGIGGERNFYFSHMLNCLYDCRYCFLQGMFESAHYVVFVNYEAFETAMDETLKAAPGEETYFFSGYDCDSLAFEEVTGFVEHFLEYFASRPTAWLELRTKSVQIGALLGREVLPNCVVAWSFTPEEIHRTLEAQVPSVERRLAAMARLAERGWPLGLRFDPLIYCAGYEEIYRGLFRQVFAAIPSAAVHSVSFGPFRLPKGFYDRVHRLYPDEPLFAAQLENRGGMISYGEAREEELMEFCRRELARYVPDELVFPLVTEPALS